MIELLKSLIESLRLELQQYGEILALLDQQQELVVVRASDDLLRTVASINKQSTVIQSARQHRQSCQREMARFLEQSAETAFLDLIPLLPEEYRPLLRALIDENNQLLLRVQQRARQNHLLLNRSLDLMQRFINTLSPGSRMPTYDGMGNLFPAALGARPIYEAVG